MKNNPTITELYNNEKFCLVKELEHGQIKEFVLSEIKGRNKFIKLYVFYQTVMIFSGMLFLGISVIKAFDGNNEFLKYSTAALIFGFSLMIVFHELIHGAALKLVGASKVNYGAYLKKFMFYAEADSFVMNKKQFTIVVMAPLVVVKVITLTGILIFLFHPAVYFFVVLMCLHSIFCAGDIGLLSFFYRHTGEVYTYDNKSEKKSYYFVEVLEKSE